MEKYYLVIVQNDSIQAVYGYNSYDDAVAAFHSELAYRGDGRLSTMCAILTASGNLVKTERWERMLQEG